MRLWVAVDESVRVGFEGSVERAIPDGEARCNAPQVDGWTSAGERA